MKPFEKGDKVRWQLGTKTGVGRIVAIYTDKITYEINGKEKICNASRDKPAYLIEQLYGNEVLKSHPDLTLDRTADY